MSVGAYCATVLRDVAARSPGEQPVVTQVALGEVAATRRQLVRIGTNLNQIAAAANAGREIHADQLAAVLAAVRATNSNVEQAIQAIIKRMPA